VFGGYNPHADLPRLLSLYRSGEAEARGTRDQALRPEQVNEGYDDLLAGRHHARMIVFLTGERAGGSTGDARWSPAPGRGIGDGGRIARRLAELGADVALAARGAEAVEALGGGSCVMRGTRGRGPGRPDRPRLVAGSGRAGRRGVCGLDVLVNNRGAAAGRKPGRGDRLGRMDSASG